MLARSGLLRLASVQQTPMLITSGLVKKALQGALACFPHSDHPRRDAEIEFCYAYSMAMLADLRVRNGSMCEAGPPRAAGGERAKKRIALESHNHISRVAEPFSKMLDENSRERLAREIIAGRELFP